VDESSVEEEAFCNELGASVDDEEAFVLLEVTVTAVGSGILPVKLAAAFQFVLVGPAMVCSETAVPVPTLERLTMLMLSV
jgi:hypothetical protein